MESVSPGQNQTGDRGPDPDEARREKGNRGRGPGGQEPGVRVKCRERCFSRSAAVRATGV